MPLHGRIGFFTATLLFAGTVLAQGAAAPTTLLNVSYDVMRDFYKDLNPAFTKHWKEKTGETIVINMSHGGSSRQARAVVDGLDADVITMNQATDIDVLASRGIVPADWSKRLPNASAPFTTATVFIVRKGNPKNLRDWNDLVQPGVQVIVPNPKTSGNGRYSYLTAWEYARRSAKTSDIADPAARGQDFVGRLFRNVPVLDTGGRGATSTFIQRGIGDVLITFEQEAELIAREFGRGNFEVVYPSLTILVEPPVAIVDRVVDRKGTRKAAQAYLDFLYSPAGQEIAAQNYLRPSNADIAKKYSAQFPRLATFTIDDSFGGWARAQKEHFDDGGLFDRIFAKTGR